MTPNFLSFMALCLLVILSVFALSANAADVEISWDAPTERVDGSPLSVEEIRQFNIYYLSNGVEQVQSAQGDESTATITSLFGLYAFSMTTVDINGLESERSDPLELLITYPIRMNIKFSVTCAPPAICIDPGDL